MIFIWIFSIQFNIIPIQIYRINCKYTLNVTKSNELIGNQYESTEFSTDSINYL